jgi:hypothetical protein
LVERVVESLGSAHGCPLVPGSIEAFWVEAGTRFAQGVLGRGPIGGVLDLGRGLVQRALRAEEGDGDRESLLPDRHFRPVVQRTCVPRVRFILFDQWSNLLGARCEVAYRFGDVSSVEGHL